MREGSVGGGEGGGAVDDDDVVGCVCYEVGRLGGGMKRGLRGVRVG